jgi:uncharacterized protein (DUF2062 family)
MPRKFLKRILGRFKLSAKDKKLRRLFGDLLHDSNLWHLNRYSVAWGVSVGLFVAFVPVPFQMPLAAALAILIGCNLPVSIAVVWVSNPVTLAPLFFASYKVGVWILNVTPRPVKFEISIDWLQHGLGAIWEPFLLGCLVLGLLTAGIGHLAVRLIWRIHVITSWRERQRRREARAAKLAATTSISNAGGKTSEMTDASEPRPGATAEDVR